MNKKKILIAASAVLIVFSGMMVTSASARSPFGPAGLGANLHRRFIIKQAIRDTNRGRVVRNRQIIRLSRPQTYGVIRTRRSGW